MAYASFLLPVALFNKCLGLQFIPVGCGGSLSLCACVSVWLLLWLPSARRWSGLDAVTSRKRGSQSRTTLCPVAIPRYSSQYQIFIVVRRSLPREISVRQYFVSRMASRSWRASTNTNQYIPQATSLFDVCLPPGHSMTAQLEPRSGSSNPKASRFPGTPKTP